MKNYIYETEFEVRDYECDIQGIVNNSVYQNYLEHTRHKFLLDAGLNFVQLHKEHIDPVVYRVELDYKFPLKSTDVFISKLNYERDGLLKIIFNQDIYRKSDNKLIVKARIIAVVLKNGKPIVPDIFLDTFESYKQSS